LFPEVCDLSTFIVEFVSGEESRRRTVLSYLHFDMIQKSEEISEFSALLPDSSTWSAHQTKGNEQQQISISVDHGDDMIKETEEQLMSLKRHSVTEVAIALPGGGIRCAAFSHGVLRYLMESESFKVKAMCCVSGGGYLGASFVHNVYQSMETDGKSFQEAVHDFFRSKKMAKNASYILRCDSVSHVLREILLLSAVFTVWILLLLLGQVPMWFFIAFVVDDMLGPTIRTVGWAPPLVNTLIIFSSLAVILWLGRLLLPKRITFFQRLRNLLIVCFTGLVLIVMLLVLIKVISETGLEQLRLDQLTVVSLFLLLLLLRPIFELSTPRGAVGILSIFVYVLFVSQVCIWRVFKGNTDLIGVGSYSESKWKLLFTSSALLMIVPFSVLQRSYFHHFYRWRLQSSFFDNVGPLGLSGIPFFDKLFACFGGLRLHPTLLRDLRKYENVLPHYIALTVLNGWKQQGLSETAFHAATLETGGAMRLVGDPTGHGLVADVGHVPLGEAMTLSAAALAYRMGAYDPDTPEMYHRSVSGIDEKGIHAQTVGHVEITQNRGRFRFWQIELGFGLGNWIHTKEISGYTPWLIVFTAQSIFTILALMVAFWNVPPMFLLVCFGVWFLLIVLGILLPPDREWIRWIFEFPFFLNIHQLLSLNMFGGNPLPPQVYLSDGAHADNMALLPLLDRRCYRTIVICDGTEDPEEHCLKLLASLNLARRYLRCSFLPEEPDLDIEAAIRRFSENYSCSCLRFRVFYCQDRSNELFLTQSEIVYLKPRRGFVASVSHFFDSLDLYGCCCVSCHHHARFLRQCIGTFPQHLLINQCFTEKQFEQYSILGHTTAAYYLGGEKEHVQMGL